MMGIWDSDLMELKGTCDWVPFGFFVGYFSLIVFIICWFFKVLDNNMVNHNSFDPGVQFVFFLGHQVILFYFVLDSWMY